MNVLQSKIIENRIDGKKWVIANQHRQTILIIEESHIDPVLQVMLTSHSPEGISLRSAVSMGSDWKIGFFAWTDQEIEECLADGFKKTFWMSMSLSIG